MRQLLFLYPILQMRKLSYKEMKKLALGPAASKWQGWERNSSSLSSNTVLPLS